MKAELVAFLGGIRSGKSRLAEERFQAGLRAKRWEPFYLATLVPGPKGPDPEMRARIQRHQRKRPLHWNTLECGREPLRVPRDCEALLLDGLGMWVAGRMSVRGADPLAELNGFLQELQARVRWGVLVLDETGLGGVSANRMQRRFTDLNGLANQAVAAVVGELWSVQAGLASRIK